MNEITIVTAFFDIGRGEWTASKQLPGYLHRTTDTYFERFSHLATLDNEMVVFTSPDLVDRVLSIRKKFANKTKVISLDFHNLYQQERKIISDIQASPQFQSRINPREVKNPEYWSADYVLVNFLKSHFVNYAIQNQLTSNEIVSWVDFGYCRGADTLGGNTKWQYNFDQNKIHFFNFRTHEEMPFDISTIIENNIVYVLGACIVAGKNMWPKLEELMKTCMGLIVGKGFVDDDQTLLHMSYLSDRDSFEIHRIDENDPFIVFREYNI
jgi:protein YibB